MRRQRAYDLEVDPRRLLGGELLHRLVEGRDALTLDEERRTQDLVLDRFGVQVVLERERLQPLEGGADVACGPGLELCRDELAELDQELMRAACPRSLAQSADSSVRADDLGQDRVLAVVGGHTQLDPVAELAQKPQQLVAPGLEEVAGERRLVVEDDSEAERDDRAVLERGAENVEVAQQVGPLGADLARGDGTRQRGELAEADRLNRSASEAGAGLRGCRVGRDDAVAVERGGGKLGGARSRGVWSTMA